MKALAPIATSEREQEAPTQRDLFAELSESERAIFLSRCKERVYAPGDHLFSQKERYSATHLISSGIVRSYYLSSGGKEITIAYWSEGAVVGGPHVFNERGTHIWSAQAVTPVRTLAIKGGDLEETSRAIPALAHYLIDTLTFKLHWVSVLLQLFGTESVRLRLAHLLLQLSEHYGESHPSGMRIKHHFSHEELARMVGATRSWVSVTLNGLKRDGLITCDGRHLVVVDRKGLLSAAETAAARPAAGTRTPTAASR
jgi:CRP-like cAMP-binding protein